MTGAFASEPGSQASPEAAVASSPSVSIPRAKKWSRMEPWKRALRPLAEQFARQFKDLDDEYLAALVEARAKVSSINCWWVEYHLAAAAAEIAEVELSNRASAIEARRAETLGSACESAAPSGETPISSGEAAELARREGV